MHDHAYRPARYVVLTTDAGTWLAHDLDEVLDALAAAYGGGLWDAIRTEGWEGETLRTRARVETLDGAPVASGAVAAFARARHDARCAERLAHRRGRFAFRDAPVPGVHRRTNGGWMRQPRHRAEHVGREAGRQDLREEGVAVPSGRGASGGPATAWDDIPRRRERCWKAQRRAQWKGARP